MSHLTLVRHGQASMFSDDYDKLSQIGETQAQRLAAYWIERGVTFDEIFAGPRQRQLKTEELVRTAYQEAGLNWPQPIIIDELDEYDGDGVIREFLPVFRECDDHIRDLAAANEKYSGTAERYKHFQRMFEAVTRKWVEGTNESSNVESWRKFHDRVSGVMNQIISRRENSGGRRIAVFTSGGPISIFTQVAVNAPEASALDLSWRVRNCSLTEIVFTRGKVTLDTFNAVPHLAQSRLLTYR